MPTGGTVLQNNVPTLYDIAKRLDPDGKVPIIAELLNQSNEILDDAVWKEGNLPTGHRVTIRTGLPTAYFRQYNQAVPTSKSETTQVDEQASLLEAWFEVDADEVELNGNQASYRYSEGLAFLEALNQQQAQTMFYGNVNIYPTQYPGLSTRYSSLSGGNAQNIINAGGSTASNQTSIWLAYWSDQSLFGIFPQGTKAGLIHKDFGLQVIQGTDGIGGNRLEAYQEKWSWKAGLALKDWRYVVRIANIDTTNLINIAAAADLVTLMIKAKHRVPIAKLGRPAFYMNRTVYEMLDIQRRFDVQQGGQLKYEVVDGEENMSFRGIPLRRVDQLLLTEAVVS